MKIAVQKTRCADIIAHLVGCGVFIDNLVGYSSAMILFTADVAGYPAYGSAATVHQIGCGGLRGSSTANNVLWSPYSRLSVL